MSSLLNGKSWKITKIEEDWQSSGDRIIVECIGREEKAKPMNLGELRMLQTGVSRKDA